MQLIGAPHFRPGLTPHFFDGGGIQPAEFLSQSRIDAAQQFGAIPRLVDTLWFALIGSMVTVVVGAASSRVRGSGTIVGGAAL